MKYISLREATKYCNYSQEYLSLRARQGKLKAIKLGRNWVTTKEWLEEYIQRVQFYFQEKERKKKRKIEVKREEKKKRRDEKNIKTGRGGWPPFNLPVEKEGRERSKSLSFFSIKKFAKVGLLLVLLVLIVKGGLVFLKKGEDNFISFLNEISLKKTQNFKRKFEEIKARGEFFLESSQMIGIEIGRNLSALAFQTSTSFQQKVKDLGEGVKLLTSKMESFSKREGRALTFFFSPEVWENTFETFKEYGFYLNSLRERLGERFQKNLKSW